MYFAKEKGKEYLQSLEQRMSKYYTYLSSSNRVYWAKRALKEYYVGKFDSQQVRKDNQGRLKINVAELQNFVQYTMSLIANQPPSFDPVATNSDSKSQYQVKISRSILDYYTYQAKLNTFFKQALEMAIVTTECFGSLSWDVRGGEAYGVEDEEIKPQGDIKFDLHDITDTIRDVANRKSIKNEWYILRRQINKYELSAQYPKHVKEIEGCEIKMEDDKELNYDSQVLTSDSDQIYYYEFRHAKTAVLPEGRLTKFIPGTVLEDSKLPYNTLLIYKIEPKKEMRSNFSWSNTYDLVAFQQSITKFYSIMLTNLSAFGYQNIVSTKGANISVSQISKGLRHFQVNDGEKIESLNLTNIPQEAFSALGAFEKKAEVIAGLNSVVKGQPEASLKSGAALALVASQAISFLSGLDESYTDFQQDVATGVIDILKVYAKTPRMIAIAGVSNSSLIQEKFTVDDIKGVNRVIVQKTNPLSKTIAGRTNLADMLLEKEQINMEQYMNVINTGQVESILEADTSQVTLIKSENEALRMGQPVIPLRTDNHPIHIEEHLVLLNDPVLRQEGDLVNRVLEHVEAHETFEKEKAQAEAPTGGEGLPGPEVLNPQANPVGMPVPTVEGDLVDQPNMPTLPENTPEELQASYSEMTGEPQI